MTALEARQETGTKLPRRLRTNLTDNTLGIVCMRLTTLMMGNMMVLILTVVHARSLFHRLIILEFVKWCRSFFYEVSLFCCFGGAAEELFIYYDSSESSPDQQ